MSEPEPIMAHLLIDSLRQQLVEVLRDMESLVENIAIPLDNARCRAEAAEQQVATLTEALEKIRDGDRECLCTHGDEYCCARAGAFCPHCIAAEALSEATLASCREPITYVRCSCDHPGDTPACDVDHDQVQHER